MFRLRLHPTPSGFAFGFALIALWALLWVWFIAQLAGTVSMEALTAAPGPELTSVVAPLDSAG